MLATSLPLLPPPATSLLPPLHHQLRSESSNTNEAQNSLQAQQQQRRAARGQPHMMHPRSELAMLAYEERVLSQRKLAIQRYGYSWLRPAGCTKTMLGRKEEEIEREEVERQLREVELQERNAAEMEEAERQAQLDQQRGREAQGEDVGAEGERDLDDEVPDMDAEGEYDDGDDSAGEEDEEDEEDEVDLDGDIPEGDSGWAYDTNRDPDTESEGVSQSPALRPSNRPRARFDDHVDRIASSFEHERGDPVELAGREDSMGDQDEFEYAQSRDLDDDIPDMDGGDLDDEVPDADDDAGWEHTDTELEESDMDISIMPPGVTAHRNSILPSSSNISQRQRRHLARQSNVSNISEQSNASAGAGSSLRRTSGNVPLPMAPPPQPASRPGRQGLASYPSFTPDQIGSDFSVSALISTGNTGMSSDQPGQFQRAWLDPASARRNLFGMSRGQPQSASTGGGMGNVPAQQPAGSLGAVPNLRHPQAGSVGAQRQVSSGGLFTPPNNVQRDQQGLAAAGEPRSRTRSGRVLGGNRGSRRTETS